MTLVIEPNETLQFYGPRNEKLSSSLKLKNEDSSKILAVRLFTNTSKCLSVRSTKFLVKPNDSASIAVHLKPFNMDEKALKIKISSCALGGSFISDDLFDLIWKQAEVFLQIESRFIDISYYPRMVSFAPLVNVIIEKRLTLEGGTGGDQQPLAQHYAIMTQEPLKVNETQDGDGNEVNNDNVDMGEGEEHYSNELAVDNWGSIAGGNDGEDQLPVNNNDDWNDGQALNEQAGEAANQVEGQDLFDVNNNQDVIDENNNHGGFAGVEEVDWNPAIQPPAEQNNQAQVAVNHAFNEEQAEMASVPVDYPNAPPNQWDYQGGFGNDDAWGQADNEAGFNENDLQGGAVPNVEGEPFENSRDHHHLSLFPNSDSPL